VGRGNQVTTHTSFGVSAGANAAVTATATTVGGSVGVTFGVTRDEVNNDGFKSLTTNVRIRLMHFVVFT